MECNLTGQWRLFSTLALFLTVTDRARRHALPFGKSGIDLRGRTDAYNHSLVDDVSGAKSPIIVPHVIREFHRQVSVQQRRRHRRSVAAAVAEIRDGGSLWSGSLIALQLPLKQIEKHRSEMCEFILRHAAP